MSQRESEERQEPEDRVDRKTGENQCAAQMTEERAHLPMLVQSDPRILARRHRGLPDIRACAEFRLLVAPPARRLL
jgi:hypothetical protein